MKIAALISGGVDSSVAISMLAQSGEHEIKAYYLKIWLEDELSFLGDCPWEDDLKYARAVCEKYDIPLEIIPLQTEYHDRVVEYVISELKKGRTPSPDIFCNQRIKFGAFLEKLSEDFDKICTGHYARTETVENRNVLKKGIDPIKDQTYFLSHLSQQQVDKCLFPLGDMPKSDVRKLAAEFELINQSRPDSQGICFLGKIQYNDFVKFHLGEKSGDICELETGKVLGQHKGFWFHTIGQRKGLSLSGGPWFVVDKDTEKNIVYVSHDTAFLDKARSSFSVADANWIHQEPDLSKTYRCKLRHGAKTFSCKLASSAAGYDVELDESDTGIAPGQFCVIYDDQDVCLGGATIS